MTLIVKNREKIVLENIWPLLRHYIFRYSSIFLKTVNPTSLMYRNRNIALSIFHQIVPVHNGANCDKSWENSVRKHLTAFTFFVFLRFSWKN